MITAAMDPTAPRTSPNLTMIHEGRAMASRVKIIVNGPSTLDAGKSTMRYLEHLEALWSRFRPDSDTTRVNLHAGTTVPVAEETIDLVDAMRDAWLYTDGLYDPTILPILVEHGYRASKIDPDALTELPESTTAMIRDRSLIDRIVIDGAASTIMLPAGTALDPGGIGKGLAADKAVDRLLRDGAAGALVSIGGDIAASGQPPDPMGWFVDVEHPIRSTEPLTTVSIDSGGVATSSTVSRSWVTGTQTRHHLIDPRSNGQSTTDLATVTIFAGSGSEAEAFATAAILQGSHAVLGFLSRHDLSGIAVTADGAVLSSPDLSGIKSTTIGRPE